MCARPVVIGKIPAQDAAEMGLVEHDHMIQTLAAQRTDHAFDIGICHGLRGLETTFVIPRLAIRRRTFSS